MNYLFTYLGNNPEYIKYCLNTVLSVDNEAKIYFSSDIQTDYKNVTYLPTTEIASDLTKEVENINVYKNTNYEDNPLWNSSLLRIFYLYDMAKAIGIESFVHFDLDVLIYKSFEEVKQYFIKDKFNITPCTENEIIFGYSYVDGLKNYLKVIDAIFENIQNEEIYKKQRLNEMKMLSKISKVKPELFNLLPVTPQSSGNILFDPASYGQYIGGLDGKPRKIYSKPWAGQHHYAGKEIIDKKIKVKFKNNLPLVIKGKEKYNLVNLHIHSKELKKYLPKCYKAYI